MQALKLGLAAACVGPATTGKTETAKESRYVVYPTHICSLERTRTIRRPYISSSLNAWFLSMTQALKLGLAAACVGPANTGKTETAKERIWCILNAYASSLTHSHNQPSVLHSRV